MRTVIFAGIFLCVCLFGDAEKLPSSWGTCHKSDKEFSECLRKNIEIAVNQLNKPTPELGLTSLDPFYIPELHIGEGKGPVNVAQHFKNVKLYGLTNVKVFKANVDFENRKLTATTLNPNVRLQADYSMNGKVLLLPIVGDGPCNITFVDMEINHVLTWETVEKEGKTYMKAVDFTITMNPKKVIFKFDNLFNGQEELGDNINKVLNEGNKEVFNDTKEEYEKNCAQIFFNLANQVLLKVPMSEIFLE